VGSLESVRFLKPHSLKSNNAGNEQVTNRLPLLTLQSLDLGLPAKEPRVEAVVLIAAHQALLLRYDQISFKAIDKQTAM
jgi:hypothetical protein